MEKVVVYGAREENAVTQLETCLTVSGDAARGVLCADHHKGYSMPIGGVIASADVVMPAGVGYDIACGNCAVRTNIKTADVDIRQVMDAIWKTISFGVGRANHEAADDPVFETIAASPVRQQRAMLKLASDQLGTVGSGNHYVDLFDDRADGSLWVGVHFGSRGFGHKTACGFLALAEGKSWDARVADDMDGTPAVIAIDTPLAQDYLAAMDIAGEYAYAGRNWVVNRVLKILGAQPLDRVHNHHNFAWWETHDGRRQLVTRKGATPAFPGQRGFIGATMGENAVIIEGVDSGESRRALYSTVHGAGRMIGRRKAKGKTHRVQKWKCQNYRNCDFKGDRGGFHKDKDGPTPTCPNCGHKLRLETFEEQLSPGLVDWAASAERVRNAGIELRGAGADEAPECYKRLPEVLAAHGSTIKVLHTLRPIGVAMAGSEVFDPYKD